MPKFNDAAPDHLRPKARRALKTHLDAVWHSSGGTAAAAKHTFLDPERLCCCVVACNWTRWCYRRISDRGAKFVAPTSIMRVSYVSCHLI